MILALLFAMGAAPGILTIEDAVALALQRHPETRAARAAEAVAAAQMAVARGLRTPEFRFSRNNFDLDPQTLEERSSVGIRFWIPRPREQALKQAAARARQGMAAAESRAAESKLAVETRLAFRRAALAEERVRVAERLAKLRQDQQKMVLRQVSLGLKEADESELAALSAAEAENELGKARAAAESERRKLMRLIGGPEGAQWVLATDRGLFEKPAELPSKVELAARGSSSRAELEAAEEECRQYRVAESLAKNERYPWLSFAQVTYRTTLLADRGAWGFQLGVDLPLWRTEAEAKSRVAAAQRNRCEMERQALRARIQGEVEERAASVEELRRELGELEKLRTGPAERAASRLRVAIEAGRADHVDALNAEARVLSLRDRWLEKRMLYASAEAQLEAAVGEVPGW